MAFIILLQTLDKNCGNFKCPDKLDFIYSHAKIKIKIKKRWLQKVHYILYKFIILKYHQYKKKLIIIIYTHQVPCRTWWPTMKYPSLVGSGTL